MNRNRLLLAVGAVAVAAVIVVVVLVVSSGSKSPKSAAPTVARTIFNGVVQNEDTLGVARAPATLTVFEDPQCPFCRQWAIDTLPTVINRYVRTGRVKLVYRGIAIIGPESIKGLRAIYAAGAKNKLWNMADRLYQLQGAENSGWITDAVIGEASSAISVNGNAILAASTSSAVDLGLAHAKREADFAGVSGTPTFLIGPPGQPRQLSVPALDPASFTAALDAALK